MNYAPVFSGASRVDGAATEEFDSYDPPICTGFSVLYSMVSRNQFHLKSTISLEKCRTYNPTAGWILRILGLGIQAHVAH